MARSDRYKNMGVSGETDLLPFMNLLAILIPALLSSTEYIKVATIEVASPKIGPQTPTEDQQKDPDEKPPLNLHLGLSSNGIYVKSSQEQSPEEQAAALANPGPTVPKVTVTVYRGRQEDGKEVEALRVWKHDGKKYIFGVREASQQDIDDKLASFKANGSLKTQETLDYNFPLLHEKLKAIKKEYEKESTVIISADPNIPYETIIRTMDSSRAQKTDEGMADMFPHVTLSAGVV